MKKSQLEAILSVESVKGRAIAKYARYVPALPDLYNVGCSVKQLAALFGVSKKFVRTHLGDDFKFRRSGPRDKELIPKPDRVIAILKRHGLALDDLQEPSEPSSDETSSSTPRPKRGAKK